MRRSGSALPLLAQYTTFARNRWLSFHQRCFVDWIVGCVARAYTSGYISPCHSMSCRVYTWAWRIGHAEACRHAKHKVRGRQYKDDEENNLSRRKFQFLNLLATGTAGSGKVKPTAQPLIL